MKYKCKEDFIGSPNGCFVKSYDAGVEYAHSDLGDDLATVALDEGWIVSADKAVDPEETTEVVQEVVQVEVTLDIIKDCMTIAEMKSALKKKGIVTRAKKEDALAKLILKHNLFGGK